MFWKRRSVLAAGLVLLAAFCWALGQSLMPDQWRDPADQETVVYSQEDLATAPSEPASQEDLDAFARWYRGRRTAAYPLCALGLAAGAGAIFLLRQKAPMLGPDGAAAALGVWTLLNGGSRYLLNLLDILLENTFSFWPYYLVLPTALRFAMTLALLVCLRELWGWLRGRGGLGWCAVARMAHPWRRPELALALYAAWAALFAVLAFTLAWGNWGGTACFLASASFAGACLWRYGADLGHFQRELDNFQAGRPIVPGNGVFQPAEERLLDIRAQQEQAVRTAITSERFKVELIANVSHDLRTPLTAILGYSELLQKETLTPEGKAQLRRLEQKAAYMNELVENLFDLTKVSSGVAEAKKEEIDLLRLLEQTVGLFDDQLAGAALAVRRSYPSPAIPLITDGARMHQVFANLLSNAIKYAMPGTRIYLEVTAVADGYRVRMTNTASYEMDFQPEEIVQRFARGDKSRSTKGSGLGLAIAQTYTQSVGGSFRVTVDGDQFSAIVTLPKTDRNL